MPCSVGLSQKSQVTVAITTQHDSLICGEGCSPAFNSKSTPQLTRRDQQKPNMQAGADDGGVEGFRFTLNSSHTVRLAGNQYITATDSENGTIWAKQEVWWLQTGAGLKCVCDSTSCPQVSDAVLLIRSGLKSH